jgi:hypothetical protein
MTYEVNYNVVCGKMCITKTDVLADGPTKVYNKKCALFHSVCSHMTN